MATERWLIDRRREVLPIPSSSPVPPPAPPESVHALMLRVTGLDIERCLVCQQGQLRQVEWLPPAPPAWDTS